MAGQPSGTVTLLFTDIEGSTRLLQELGRERYAEALELHRRFLRESFQQHGGYEVDSEGDSFFVAFARAEEAAAAAAAAQRMLAATAWPGNHEVRVRMGLHTGEPLVATPKYVGLDVHRAARIMAAAHGRQVLVSQSTRELLDDRVPLLDLGEHRLKDLEGLQRLYQLVVDPDVRFPPLRTAASVRSNLPPQPTRLIGRHVELAEIRKLLLLEGVSLVTLTGAGGSGKTRLAVRVGTDLLHELADGVCFVNLAAVQDEELVPSAIAQALGLREVEGQPAEETLAAFLRERGTILVLDNFEHLLAAAGFVSRLRASAPGVKLLVTSREPLHLSGEHEYPVLPFQVPPADVDPDPDALADFDSVALFTERARAVRPGFRLDASNARQVAAICARLDGLPLAIELAAARVKLLSAEALLSRLEQRLDVLTGGARDLPERQQTLRRTIEWSYDLLDAETQLLFDRLSVFVGGRSLEAIEAVCNVDGGLDVFDGVASLVDKSLLREDGSSEPRFVMLETIHEYSRDRLRGRGEEAELRLRHLRCFSGLAETAEPLLRGPEQPVWIERLERDQGNLRAALSTAVEIGDLDAAARIASALALFWEARGQFFEVRRWFEIVLREPERLREATRGGVLFWSGRLAVFQGNWDHARGLLLSAVEAATRVGDNETLSLALGKLGWVEVEQGRGFDGLSFVGRAVRLARELDDDWVLAEVLNDDACSRFFLVDLPAARRSLDESLALRRMLGDELNIADSLNNLGYTALLGGELDEAARFLDESLELAQRIGDARHIALALGNLAIVELLRGNGEAARSRFVECIEHTERLGDERSTLEALIGLAALACEAEPERAARIVGAVAHLHRDVGGAASAGERMMDNGFISAARTALGPGAWTQAEAAGAAMTLAEVVAYALGSEAEPR